MDRIEVVIIIIFYTFKGDDGFNYKETVSSMAIQNLTISHNNKITVVNVGKCPQCQLRTKATTESEDMLSSTNILASFTL